MSEEKRHITNRHDLDDFIGVHPNWLLRSGITIVALFLLALFVLSNFIQYPDKIVARGKLTSDNPPIEIKAKVGGVIDQLIVQDQSNIEINDPILYLKNTAIESDIESLRKFINKYQNRITPSRKRKLDIPNNLKLGVLQPEYDQLIFENYEYQNLLSRNDVVTKIASIQNEIQTLNKIGLSEAEELRILEKELELVGIEKNRAQEMLNKGIISQQEMENVDIKYLQLFGKINKFKSSTLDKYLKIDQLTSEQSQLEEQRASVIKTYELKIAKLISTLNSKLAQWKDDFYLLTPASGVLNLNKDIVTKKNIVAGESIGHIVNKEAGDRFIQTTVPARGIGKVQKGNEVIVKFDAFPHREFGVVNAVVKEIAIVPNATLEQTHYDVLLSIPDELVTTYDRELPYQANATVTAEIITANQTVLQRIFNQFRDLTRN